MPVYEYFCPTCGENFERNIPFTGKNSAVTCPKGHHHTRRVYSVPTISFKGTGWYSTDHKGYSSGKNSSVE